MTKKQSSVLYGTAILLMLYFHLFGAPGLPDTEYVSVLNFAGGGINLERALSWFGRICVGIYAFISGYGMYRSLVKVKAHEGTFWKRLKNIYSSIVKRILVFMRKYWLVFCIFVPIGFALGVYKTDGILPLIENIVSLRYDYNGAWWYVMQYIFMILLVPAVDLFFDFLFAKKCRTIKTFAVLAVQFAFYAAFFLLVFPLYKNAAYYTAIFVIGYLCSRFDLFSKLIEKIPGGAPSYIIGWALIAAAFLTRTLLAKNPGHIGSDVVLAPAFCFAVCLLTRKSGKITGAFAWLGKYSVYMWLTHNFFWLYFFPEFSTITRISTLMYFQLVATSLLTSAVLLFLEKQLCKLGTKVFHVRSKESLPPN